MAIKQNENVYFKGTLTDDKGTIITDFSSLNLTALIKTVTSKRTVHVIPKSEMTIDEEGNIAFVLPAVVTKMMNPEWYNLEFLVADSTGNNIIGETRLFNLEQSNFAQS